jgi:thiamine biosynthesis lipoprotein
VLALGGPTGAEAIAAARPATAQEAGLTFDVFGTFGSLVVTRPDALDAGYRLLAAELAAIDAACSRFRPDSELSVVNRSAGRVTRVSPLFAVALQTALTAAALTDDDVDPTCGGSLVRLGYDRDFAEVRADVSALAQTAAPAPGWRLVELDLERQTVRMPAGVVLDLGATAKALAADRGAARVATAIGCGALVNLGGDIAIAGQPPTGGWRIEVRDELPADEAEGQRTRQARGQVVSIESGGLATSCTASRAWRRGEQRLHHIIVPGTGRPADGCWRTVTVAAATCVGANTASTAAIIRGEPAARWLDENGLPARLVRGDGRVVTTGGWPADDPGEQSCT